MTITNDEIDVEMCGWAFFAFAFARSYLLQRKETNRRTIDMEIFFVLFPYSLFLTLGFLGKKNCPGIGYLCSSYISI